MKEKTKNNRVQEFIKGILLIFLYLAASLGASLLKYYHHDILSIIVDFGFIILLIFLFRKILKDDFKKLKTNFKKNFRLMLKYWLLGLLIMYVGNYIAIMLVNNGNIAANQSNVNTILSQAPIYSILTIALLGPFIEEIVFRAGFKKAFKTKLSYAIFCGLLFGFFHIIAGLNFSSLTAFLASAKEFVYLISYGALGFTFGYIYFETDNIYYSTFAHIIHNSLTLVLMLIAHLGGFI